MTAIVAPSFNDLVSAGQAELQFRRPDINPYDGSLALADLHASAAMADAVERASAQRFLNTFLGGAKGDALTVLVNDRYNLQRKTETAAQVSVAFTRASTLTAGTIAAGTLVATNTLADGSRITFSTDSPINFLVGQAGPFSVTATATTLGVAGNVAASTVVNVVSTLFDTFTVTNAAAAAGGNAEEGDDALVARARAFYATLRRGTLEALEEGALTVPSVRIAKASEDLATGFVTLAVSDENGGSTLQMVSDVEAVVPAWKCAGVVVTVIGGTLLSVDITMQVRAVTGFDVAAIASALQDAATNRINSVKVGETLYLDAVTSSIIAQYPDDLLDVIYTSLVVGGSSVASPDDQKSVIPANSGLVIRAGTIIVQAVP